MSTHPFSNLTLSDIHQVVMLTAANGAEPLTDEQLDTLTEAGENLVPFANAFCAGCVAGGADSLPHIRELLTDWAMSLRKASQELEVKP